jgi:hypothetical protein
LVVVLVEENASPAIRRGAAVESNSCTGKQLLVERATVVEGVFVEEKLEVGGRNSKV